MSHPGSARRPLCAALLLALAAPAAAAQGTALPSAESLVARHVAAIGGEQAVRAHSSMRMKGTFELASAGLKGDFTVVSAAPNRNALTIDIPGLGQIRSGYDGTTGWEFNPMVGARLLEGEELARVAEESDFHGGSLRRQSGIAGRQTVERTVLGGTPCYRVKVTWKSGRESHECYAVDGGLLVAVQSTYVGPMGRIETTQLLDDYETFGGIRHPTVLRQQMMGAEQVLTVTDVAYDSVAPADVVPPAAIRTLIAGKQQAPRQPPAAAKPGAVPPGGR